MTEGKKFNAWIPNFGAKGWGITLTCFVFFIFYTFWNSVTNTLFGMFTEQYGWQQTDMSYVITIAGWISLLAVVLFGALGRKIGAKMVSVIGAGRQRCRLHHPGEHDKLRNVRCRRYRVLLLHGRLCDPSVWACWAQAGSRATKGAFMGIATIGMTFCSAALTRSSSASWAPAWACRASSGLRRRPDRHGRGRAVVREEQSRRGGAYPPTTTSPSAARSSMPSSRPPWNTRRRVPGPP